MSKQDAQQMDLPEHLHYTKAHAWMDRSTDPVVVGITDYAQDQLGELVFADLPAVGTAVSAGDEIVSLESSKAVDALVSPVSGTIAAVNTKLEDDPEIVNRDPYGEGWMVTINATDADNPPTGLLTAAQYRDYIADL